MTVFGIFCFAWILSWMVWQIFGKKRILPNTLPGPVSFPFIGSAIQLAYQARSLKHFEFFGKLCQKYGPVVKVKAGVLDIVIVEDYEIARKVLCSEDFGGRFPATQLFYGPTLNQNCGLFFGHGESWKEIRRFTLRSLHQFGFANPDTLECSIAEELHDFLQDFDETVSQNNGDVCLHHIFNLPALNLVWRIMAGIRLSNSDPELQKFIAIAAELTSLPSIGTQPLYAFPFLQYIPGASNYSTILQQFRKMQQIFKDILEQRRRLQSYKTTQNDFIDLFLKEIDDRKGSVSHFNDVQLIQACMDLVLAGTDTTSNALEFCFLYMTKYPEIQEKVRQEIDTVVGASRLPTLYDRVNMHYTEAVILESLRFANTAPVMYRTALKNTTLLGCLVEKNTIVSINLTRIHMNEKIWGDPEEFRPSRFLDHELKVIKDHKLLAFGGGKRVCLGKQLAKATLFTFLTAIIQKYTLGRSETQARLSIKPMKSAITNVPAPFKCFMKLRS